VLGAIGLDDVQEGAYRALVGLGAADVADLAHRMGLTESEAAGVLRGLERHGLVARSSARPGRWVAAPPAVALSALLTRRRHELEQAEVSAAVLAAEFRAEATEPAVHDLVEVVTGAQAVAQRFLQLQFGAQREVCALVTGRPVAVTGMENEAERDAARRGVAYRVVVERAVVEGPHGVAEVAQALSRGERVRVLDQVPTKLVVADGTLAMVPLSRHRGEATALVVHASGLLESLTALFEEIWRQAVPLRLDGGGADAPAGAAPAAGTAVGAPAATGTPGPPYTQGTPGARPAASMPREVPPEQPDHVDLRILSLLLAGLTDAAAAKQLDVGLRTVQRRVKRLMELAGVSTRLQLGWQAYERGWVARDAR
jgi:sugar-specific transcriptional regulator TrmB